MVVTQLAMSSSSPMMFPILVFETKVVEKGYCSRNDATLAHSWHTSPFTFTIQKGLVFMALLQVSRHSSTCWITWLASS